MSGSVQTAANTADALAPPRVNDSVDPTETPLAAYVHVPFCAHKCGYCDFASVAGKDVLADEYLDALDREMSSILRDRPAVRTVFIGGGTPTYLSPAQLERLLAIVAARFDLSRTVEFTVESNPNTLDRDKVQILASHGVNRVSLGAQSFEPALLERLERHHDPSSVARAVELLSGSIPNRSIDLIFGVPGQTLAQWESDLERALALGTNHLSTYGLTYEKGTRLWRQRRLGVVQPLDEDLERAMYEHAIDRLADGGFEHYEISNFARRGGAGEGPNVCLHNLVYWANQAYHGFGTGAAAYRKGTRTLNVRDLEAYIARTREGRSVVTQSETLGDLERARETAMLHLRRLEGLDREQFLRQTNHSIDELAAAVIRDFVAQGFLLDDGRRVRLSRAGLPLADGILQAIL